MKPIGTPCASAMSSVRHRQPSAHTRPLLSEAPPILTSGDGGVFRVHLDSFKLPCLPACASFPRPPKVPYSYGYGSLLMQNACLQLGLLQSDHIGVKSYCLSGFFSVASAISCFIRSSRSCLATYHSLISISIRPMSSCASSGSTSTMTLISFSI